MDGFRKNSGTKFRIGIYYMSFKDYYFNIIYPDIFLCFEEVDDNDEIF